MVAGEQGTMIGDSAPGNLVGGLRRRVDGGSGRQGIRLFGDRNMRRFVAALCLTLAGAGTSAAGTVKTMDGRAVEGGGEGLLALRV